MSIQCSTLDTMESAGAVDLILSSESSVVLDGKVWGQPVEGLMITADPTSILTLGSALAVFTAAKITKKPALPVLVHTPREGFL